MLSAFKRVLQVGIKADDGRMSFRAFKSSSSAKDFSQPGTCPPRVDTVERGAKRFLGDIGRKNEKCILGADIMEAIATMQKADRDSIESMRAKFKEAGRRVAFLGFCTFAYCLGVFYVVGKQISSKKVDQPSPQQVPRDGNTMPACGSG